MAVSKKFLRWFSLAVVIFAANVFISKNALTRQSNATDAVANSLRIIDAIKDIQFNAANLEIAQRNYAMSGNSQYLDRANDALRAASEAANKSQSLGADGELLSKLIEERVGEFKKFRQLHEQQGFSAVVSAIEADANSTVVDRIQLIISRMNQVENRLLGERTGQSQKDTRLSFITFYISSLFNLILLWLIYFLAYREIRERRQAEQTLRFTATHDPLTALPNRTLFSERLSQRLSMRRRQHDRLAVLFIDLDRFKNINDTLGHEAGDRLLQDVAQRLSGCVRQSDTVARQGGDEFVVLVEEYSDPRDIASVSEKILTEVARPLFLEGKEFHITASIGISTFPDDGTDMHSLLKNADIAMYRAKEQGKNNYQFFAQQMTVHSIERLALEADLRRAMERNELLLHYQPKINARTGQISGMEALLRWRHPTLGMIPPSQCIPLAEETGLIMPIGEWVIRTACARNRAWQKQKLSRLRIAVNLSPRQFSDALLASNIRKILDDTHLEARWLELEITEDFVMHDPIQAARTMAALKNMGVTLTIDDFGIGHSSLAYLKRFPIDCLKIDGSFVRDIPHNADDKAITTAIIALGHSLKLKVVAEGVENDQQARFLQDENCDEMQGFYFNKPLTENEFTTLLEEQQKKPGGKSLKSQSKNLFPS